jgi:hypothetical protein
MKFALLATQTFSDEVADIATRAREPLHFVAAPGCSAKAMLAARVGRNKVSAVISCDWDELNKPNVIPGIEITKGDPKQWKNANANKWLSEECDGIITTLPRSDEDRDLVARFKNSGRSIYILDEEKGGWVERGDKVWKRLPTKELPPQPELVEVSGINKNDMYLADGGAGGETVGDFSFTKCEAREKFGEQFAMLPYLASAERAVRTEKRTSMSVDTARKVLPRLARELTNQHISLTLEGDALVIESGCKYCDGDCPNVMEIFHDE